MKDELFELSKEVFERIGWNPSRPAKGTHCYTTDDDGDTTTIPIYNSDFVLEMLPRTIKRNDITWYLDLTPESTHDTWVADYVFYDYEDEHCLFDSNRANTPLKALLKLTLALHEAGELFPVGGFGRLKDLGEVQEFELAHPRSFVEPRVSFSTEHKGKLFIVNGVDEVKTFDGTTITLDPESES